MPRGRIVTSNPVNRRHPINRGRIGWWLSVPWLYGGGRWYDLLGRWPGTLTSMANASNGWRTIARPGVLAGGLLTDGTAGYIDCGAIPLDSNNWTIAAWYNNVAASGNPHRYVAWGGSGPTIYQDSSKLAIAHGGAIDLTSTATTDSGVWVHAAIKRSGSNAAIYKNGLPVASSSSFAVSYTQDSSFRVGGSSAFGEYTNAYWDDVGAWNRGLSDAEIWSLYDLGPRGYPGVLNRRSPALLLLMPAATGTTAALAGTAGPATLSASVTAAAPPSSAATLAATAGPATFAGSVTAAAPPAAAVTFAATAGPATLAASLTALSPGAVTVALAATAGPAALAGSLTAAAPPPSAAGLAATAGDAFMAGGGLSVPPGASAAVLDALAGPAAAALALAPAGPGAIGAILAVTAGPAALHAVLVPAGGDAGPATTDPDAWWLWGAPPPPWPAGRPRLRDDLVLLDAAARIRATRFFVRITPQTYDAGPVQGDSAPMVARLWPLRWRETSDRQDPDGPEVIHRGAFALAVHVRDGDDARRLRLQFLGQSIAVDAVAGQSLAGGTIPLLTSVTEASLDPTYTAPDSVWVLTCSWEGTLGGFGGHDELDDVLDPIP